MCRDNDHGGRRCPHDTSEARRIRRHRLDIETMYGPALAPAPAPASETQTSYVSSAPASLATIHRLRDEIENLESEYQRISRDPFSIWDDTPYHFEDGVYTDSVQALQVLDAAIENRIITAGDNVVNLAVDASGLTETAVSDHILQNLTRLAEEKDTLMARPYTAAEQQTLAELDAKISTNEQARKNFEHENRNTYPMPGNRGIAARLEARLNQNSMDNEALRLQAELVGYREAANSLQEQRRTTLNHNDPRIDEIDAEVTELLRRDGQVPERIGVMLRTHANAYQQILSQIREFGGPDTSIDSKSDAHARNLLTAALNHYPTAWIEASTKGHPMRARATTLRAHYQERKDIKTKARETQVVFEPKPHAWNPPAEEAEHWQKLESDQYGQARYVFDSGRERFEYVEEDETMWVRPQWENHHTTGTQSPSGAGWLPYQRTITENGESKTFTAWRRPKYKIIDNGTETLAELTVDHSPDGFDPRPGYSTALHEYAHRIEFTGTPLITRMEEQFLTRRTTHDGVREERRRIYPDKKEYGYFDKFVSDYMGRTYDGSRSKEILSMGMESIFAGSQGGLVGVGGTRQDPEMKRFILGLLATV